MKRLHLFVYIIWMLGKLQDNKSKFRFVTFQWIA